MEEEKQVTPQEYFANYPEAPVSDTFKWLDKQGFEHMTTLRDWKFSTLVARIERAESSIIDIGGRPAKQQAATIPPASQVQERDESGMPVVDGEHKPVMINLPPDEHAFTVRGFYHGKTKKGDSVLKVVVNEKPYNSKYGFVCFKPPFNEWKSWPVVVGDGEPGLFGAPAGCERVILRDPKDGGQYPEIIEFRS